MQEHSLHKKKKSKNIGKNLGFEYGSFTSFTFLFSPCSVKLSPFQIFTGFPGGEMSEQTWKVEKKFFFFFTWNTKNFMPEALIISLLDVIMTSKMKENLGWLNLQWIIKYILTKQQQNFLYTWIYAWNAPPPKKKPLFEFV